MKRQSRCNVQHEEVPQPQEVDLPVAGLGIGHEVHSSVEVDHGAHQSDQLEKAK